MRTNVANRVFKKKMNIAVISRSKPYMEVLRLWINRIEGQKIVTEYPGVNEFLEFQNARKTDILILDHMENLYADMILIKKLSKKLRHMKILVVSMYNDMTFHKALKKCGVKGCIEKYNIYADLEDAIHTIYYGGAYFMAS